MGKITRHSINRKLLELMDIIQYTNLLVNNMPADMDTKVYDNFTIVCDMEEQLPTTYVPTQNGNW